jgi:hypothetical protein
VSVDLTTTQLGKVLGADRARAIVDGCLRRMGLSEQLGTPDELMRFAHCLIEHGGFIEVVGRSLKARAILRGARVAY